MGRMKEYYYDQLVEEQNNDQEYIEWLQNVSLSFKHDMNQMSKEELGKFLDRLNYKIASGRHTGAEKETLADAYHLYIRKFGV